MGQLLRQTYIISDLHLGGVYGSPGERGFRLCTQVPVLAGFIDQLTAKGRAGVPVELVINGDMVDFLAERDDGAAPWIPFTHDQHAAATKLEAILTRDQAFADALHRFLEGGNRLVVLLGNHDLELVLPAVRERMRRLLGVTRGHDHEFIHDGEAYVVGDVLIEHGNRYDRFNVVNQDALRHYRSLISRRQPVPAEYVFDPPPGSKMVATVINPIKEKYRFVDLLKPENGAVIPILLALEPDLRSHLSQAVRLSLDAREHRLATAAMPSSAGDISSTGMAGPGAGMDIASSGLGGASGMAGLMSDPLEVELQKQLEGEAAGFLGALEHEVEVVGRDISNIGHAIGMLELLVSGQRGALARRLPALLKALRALKQDQSFSRDVETDPDTWSSAEALAGNGIRHVVFGHTHLPKRIPLRSGGWYLNSGTWADVLAFPREIITGPDDVDLQLLTDLVDRLARGDFSEWTIFHPTYVRIDRDDSGGTAAIELCDYVAGAAV